MSPTIDLSKDLELWCDFAPRYFDSQRNRIQDKSGYGRHPEASGGPTVGGVLASDVRAWYEENPDQQPTDDDGEAYIPRSWNPDNHILKEDSA